MTVFDLHANVLDDYSAFVRSFIHIADPRISEFVEQALNQQGHLWPDFLLQVSPAYAREDSVDELAAHGVLHPETARIFRDEKGTPYRLYRHQVQAIEKARAGRSYVVTSGTGSGKSLTYFLPIVDFILRQGGLNDQTVALIVYPMNALVNSQVQALEKLRGAYEARTGQLFPVTFARYTGETKAEQRQAIRQHPPHIILTNYVMAELMLVRPEDRRLLDKARGGLRFLIFDELHTYSGRQGADVAMLIRRLKERAASPDLIHIGTSATMVASKQATPRQRRETVAAFAQRLFGYPFAEGDVIEETLVPFTTGGPPTADELRTALLSLSGGRVPALSLEAYRAHPLSRWVEHAFGLEPEVDGSGYRRRVPRTIPAAARELATQTGLDAELCRQVLIRWLILGGQLAGEDEDRALAFKLHQFIAQGRALFATLEPPDRREFSLEGQIFGREGRLFLPLQFCRHCGQEYYHVLKSESGFIPHPVGYGALEDEESGGMQAGYLMLAPPEDDWTEDLLPEEWRDAKGRIKRNYRSRVPRTFWIYPDGKIAAGPYPEAVKVWFQPQPFAICQSCGEFYTRRENEFRKLTSLSSEARSSATTVLATSVLRHAAFTPEVRDKLLTFTDNRQDAALQAGHFNDFVHRAVLRAALVAALKEHGRLEVDQVARETVVRCGLTLRDIARNRGLAEGTEAARRVWDVFTEWVDYLLFEDLKRGWRVVQPNLEELGLLRIEYRGLEALCQDQDQWAFSPAWLQLAPDARLQVLSAVLDYFRRKLAINARVLQAEQQRALSRRCEQHLNDFWGLDPDAVRLESATWFALNARAGRWTGFSLGPRSAVVRYLCRKLNLSPDEVAEFLPTLLDRLVAHGLLERATKGGELRFQLDAGSLIWVQGDGQPWRDDFYSHRVENEGYVTAQRRANAFFQRFYQDSAASLAQLEAREHTAQVVAAGERELRERRFRWDPSDTDKEAEVGRRLPYLVCSPTMELGIDIADLDIVHMRNVPPTPANYAQRSGRAGRQGQAGLILTYCGAFNTHDQYFFRHREDMVAGSVRPPQLDLANEALLRAHIHAMWLAEIGLPLGSSVEELIDTNDEDRLPLRPDVVAQIDLSPQRRERLAQRVEAMLQTDRSMLRTTPEINGQWIRHCLDAAASQFDAAFDRWRELYRVATNQLSQAQQDLMSARKPEDQRDAQRRQQEALRQRNLLLQIDTSREESDFYPYRYLASEGFLPGYNFPALPVRAWVPRGTRGEYIPRPRFLAIREFAPGNFIYHEGAQWQVVAFQSPAGGLEERMHTRRLCRTCGAFGEPECDLCPVCGTRFDAENAPLTTLLEMPDVRTRRRSRITSNEEERRRRGYLLETYYRFAQQDGRDRTVEADVMVNDEPFLRLVYAPAATLVRVNRGPRTGQVPGFDIDLNTGEWVRPTEENHLTPAKAQHTVARVNLFVQNTRNILLMRPTDPDLFTDRRVATTLLYALERGMEAAFQLDENELAAEMIGDADYRAILLYETSEGGSGVLRRLVDEPEALAQVASEALTRCHFDDEGNDTHPDCVAACYECLLSYRNQREALYLNRHAVVSHLLGLSRSTIETRVAGRSRREHLAWLRSLLDPRSVLERRFLDFLAQHGYRLPTDAQHAIEDPRCNADFFYEPDVVVFCDGAVHDTPQQRRADEELRQALRDEGYEVVVIRYDRDLGEQVNRYPEVFGVRG